MRPNARRLALPAAFASVLAAGACNFREAPASATDYGGISSEITGNHWHELKVPPADFVAPDAGASYSYSIQGKANHDHTVTYTGQQLRIVSDFNSATVESTETEAHTHRVTLDVATQP